MKPAWSVLQPRVWLWNPCRLVGWTGQESPRPDIRALGLVYPLAPRVARAPSTPNVIIHRDLDSICQD